MVSIDTVNDAERTDRKRELYWTIPPGKLKLRVSIE